MYKYKNKTFSSLEDFTKWAEENKDIILKDILSILKESYSFSSSEILKFLYQEQSPIRPRTACKSHLGVENKEHDWKLCNIIYLILLLNPKKAEIILNSL